MPDLNGQPTWVMRRTLPHARPHWVGGDAVYLVTVCCRPRAQDHLCATGLAPLVLESIQFRHAANTWTLIAAVVMPDHVHLLVRLPPDAGLAHIVSQWKRYLARTAGIRWQRDFFEHRIRGLDLVAVKVAYLRQNPVRAGLVPTAEDWPYFVCQEWDG